MWQQFVTPETVPQLVAAFALLVGAVAFVIRSIAGSISRYSETKAIMAKSQRDDVASENKQREMMLDLIASQQRSQTLLAENGANTNKILEQTRQDIVVFRDVSQSVAKALEANTVETKALRLDLKEWPAAVDSSLSTLDTHIGDMRSEVSSMDSDFKLLVLSVAIIRDEQKYMIAIMKWIVVVLSAVYEKLIGGPPPPPPDDKAKVLELRTDADGAKHNASVDAA